MMVAVMRFSVMDIYKHMLLKKPLLRTSPHVKTVFAEGRTRVGMGLGYVYK